jgi:hypothetical protein
MIAAKEIKLAQQAVAQLRAQWQAVSQLGLPVKTDVYKTPRRIVNPPKKTKQTDSKNIKPSSSQRIPRGKAGRVFANISNYDKTDLQGVCQYGILADLQDLIAQGTDVHGRDDLALRSCAMYGHTQMVGLLLDNGADIHAGNDDALVSAAGHGYTETVRLLLDRGADININIFSGKIQLVGGTMQGSMKLGSSALLRAAEKGHVETVRLLLERGADVHSFEDKALLFAAVFHRHETVDVLLAYGAPLEILSAQQRESYDAYLREQERISTLKNDFYTEAQQNLRDIFQAAHWADQPNAMTALWEQVPQPLQAGLDFQHILAETRQQAMKKQKPKIKLVK